MTAVAAGLLVAACVFAGGMFGLQAHRFVPKEHLTKETQEVVRLGTGTISVLASLVLGLLIATAKTASDTADSELRGYASDLIVLSRGLQLYGADAKPAAELLRRSTARMVGDIWPKPGRSFAGLDEVSASALLEQAQDAIRGLVPLTPGQQELRGEALQTSAALVRQRWLLIEQAGSTVQPAVIVILVSWVVAIFASFGLNAPRNATVVVAFLVCALAIGAAVFLVLEMDSPFQGVLRISDQPLLRALAHMAS